MRDTLLLVSAVLLLLTGIAHSLIGVKSPSQALELWSGFAKSQFEAFTGQSKQLAELGQKIAADTAEPIKTGANTLFQPAA